LPGKTNHDLKTLFDGYLDWLNQEINNHYEQFSKQEKEKYIHS
jgi:Ulp1 family protease